MRRTTPLRALTATAALSALLLAGCSDDPDVEDPTSASETTDDAPTTEPTTDDAPTTEPADDTDTTEPADDEETSAEPAGPISSDDAAFEVTPPAGWVNVRDQVEQEVEIAVRDDAMTDNFFTNLVVASEAPIGDLEDSIEAAAQQVAGSDGEYELIDPIQIDGEDAYGFVLTRTTSGVEVAQTQWWVEHGDRLYVATFSTAKSQQEAGEPIMDEILSTWSWAD